MVFVTTQREMSADSVRGDKLLEQRRRKLDVLSIGAANHNVPGRPAIIVQILIRCDAEVKLVSVHRISVLPTKAKRSGKASTSGREGQPHTAAIEAAAPAGPCREPPKPAQSRSGASVARIWRWCYPDGATERHCVCGGRGGREG